MNMLQKKVSHELELNSLPLYVTVENISFSVPAGSSCLVERSTSGSAVRFLQILLWIFRTFVQLFILAVIIDCNIQCSFRPATLSPKILPPHLNLFSTARLNSYNSWPHLQLIELRWQRSNLPIILRSVTWLKLHAERDFELQVFGEQQRAKRSDFLYSSATFPNAMMVMWTAGGILKLNQKVRKSSWLWFTGWWSSWLTDLRRDLL